MPLYGAARAKKASEDTAKAAVPFLNGSMAGPSPNASLYRSNTFDPVAMGLTEWSDPIYGHGEEGQMVVDNVRRGWSKLSPDGKSIQYYDMDGNDMGVGRIGGGGDIFSTIGRSLGENPMTRATITAGATALSGGNPWVAAAVNGALSRGGGNDYLTALRDGVVAGGLTYGAQQLAGAGDAADPRALENGIGGWEGAPVGTGSLEGTESALAAYEAALPGTGPSADAIAALTAAEAGLPKAGAGVLAGLTAGDIAKGVGLATALTKTKPGTADIGSLITGAANLTNPYASGGAGSAWDTVESPALLQGIQQAQFRGNAGYNQLMGLANSQQALAGQMAGDYNRTVAPALRGFADYANRIGSKDYINQQRSNAIAGVQQTSDAQQQQAIREMSRRGVNPNDPRFASMLMQQANQVALNKVRAAADAESGAYSNWTSALGNLGSLGFKQLDAAKGFGESAKGAVQTANDLGQLGLKGMGAYSQLNTAQRQVGNNFTVGMRQADAGMANAATNATKVNNDANQAWISDIGKGVGWALDNQSKVKDAWNTLSNIWG